MKCDSKKSDLWHKRMKAFENGPLNGTDYCKANNLTYSQFLYWKKKIKTKPVKSIQEKQSWANVIIDNDPILDSNTIEVGIGKVTIKIDSNFDQSIFEKVMQSLVKLC